MKLHIVAMGQDTGAPLVLLHGLFGQAANFGAVQKVLASGRRVLALDLRNHGQSPHDAVMNYPAMAADVAETLRAEGVVAADVLGHSMGGKVAMMLALTEPSLVARLIIADIAPVAYPPAFRTYAEAMLALPLEPGMTRRQADAALANAVRSPGVRGFLLQNLTLGGSHPSWRIGLPEIAAALPVIEAVPDFPANVRFDGPTLALAGEKSDYICEEHRPIFRALFPATRFGTVKDAGHWLHAEQPEGFIAAVTAFLN
jgi:pimeloyl-ACP methyl ester carboxylesterase